MTALAVISCILGFIGACLFVHNVLEKLDDACFLETGGCLSKLISFIAIGGYIIGNVCIGDAPGIAKANLVGIALGVIALIIGGSKYGPSSSSSYSSSSSGADDNKYISCVGHHPNGECMKRDSPRYKDITADNDSCSCWQNWSGYRG